VPRPTILLLEEDPETAILLTSVLSGAPAQVMGARFGAAALKIAYHNPMDLVVLDLRVPDMSGLEVWRRLRLIDADLPVIALTSQGSAEGARTCMSMGAIDYLTLPVDSQMVLRLVRETLGLDAPSWRGREASDDAASSQDDGFRKAS
jgi:DNA-binding response OmpR family regulator